MRQYVLIFSLSFLLAFISLNLYSQVSINTDGSQPDPSAMLDVKSAVKGFLPPRVALTALDSPSPVAAPVAIGLLVYNTAPIGNGQEHAGPGYYFWNGTRWTPVSTPQGIESGEMLFWNGKAWVSIPKGSHGQQLYFCDSVPSWGGCYALLTANPVTNVTFHSAISGGVVMSDGGSPVVSRGVCWATNIDPTIADYKTDDGPGTGPFTSNITGLNPNTTYFIRAYATNNKGTAYAKGPDTVFTTSNQIDAPVTIAPVVTSCAGVALDIPVTVAMFTAIKTISLTLHYNTGVLIYNGASNNSGFQGLSFNGAQTGIVTINGSAAQATTYPDNTVLFTLHFTYVGGNTSLEWFDNGTSCEFMNGDQVVLNDSPTNVFYHNGEITEIDEVEAPVFELGATSLICQGSLPVTYLATAENATSITYSLDASSISGGNSIDAITGTVTYAPGWTGTSVITASADGCGGLQTATHTVTINPLLPLTVSIAPSLNDTCNGIPVTFTATVNNGGTMPAYQWKVNGIISVANTSIFTYVPANNDVVTCTVTSNQECVTDSPKTSNPVVMIVRPVLPVYVSISPSANSVCAGQSVTFSSMTSNGGSSPSYQWKVNGNAAGTNTAMFSYMPVDDDTVTCVVTSAASCVSGNPAASNPVVMIVYPLLPVSVTVTPSANSVCSGTVVDFTATPVNGGNTPSYQWKVNGAIVGGNNATYSYAPNNNDVVTCTLSSDITCTSGNPATSVAVIMVVNPVLPVSVSVTPSANQVCAGTSVTYTALPVNGGITPTYQWKVNGINTGENSNIFTYVPAGTDVVTCELTSSQTCVSNNPATSAPVNVTVNPLLPVSVNVYPSVSTLCAGTIVIYNAIPVNGGSAPSYQWKVNGIPAGQNSPAFSYAPASNDAVTCEVNSNETCVTGNPAISDPVVIIVNPLLPVSVSIAASEYSVCAGTSVTFTASPVNGGTTPAYQWKVNGANQGFSGNTFTYIPNINDAVTCVLTSSETCTTGNPSTSNTPQVTVNPLLPVGVSIEATATTVCAGTTVTFTASAVNGGTAPGYQWKVNGVNSGTNNAEFSYVPQNNDAVTCVLTSDITCTSGNPATSNTRIITVNPLLPVSVSISASNNNVCAGTQVTFTAVAINGGNAPVYQWVVNGLNQGTNNNVFAYNPSNGDEVKCVVNSNETCVSGNPATSDSETITVNPLLPVSVSIEASATTVCDGTLVTFTATPVNGGINPIYQWTVNGIGVGGNSETYSYTPANEDVVKCQLTSGEVCTTGNPATSNPKTITVNPLQPVGISIIASATTVCTGANVTFTASPVNGGTGPFYQWKVNGNDAGGNNPVFSYVPVNSDVVSCVLNSNAVCASGNPANSNVVPITVNPLLPVSISISAPSNTICNGSQITFTAVAVNGGNAPIFNWKITGNPVGLNSPVFTYVASDNDEVICEVTSNETCVSGNPAVSNTETVTVKPLLPVSVSISAPVTNVCAGEVVICTAAPVNGGTSPAYQWMVNGINTGSNSPVFSFIPVNNDMVSCILTSSEECTTGNPATSNQLAVTVNPLLPVSLTISASENNVCAGTTVIFTSVPVNGGTVPAYQWQVDGNNVDGATNSTYSLIPVNGNTVTCILTSSETCTTGNHATSNTVYMTVQPVMPVSVSIVAAANPVCAGTSVDFTAIPVNGGITPSFQWQVNSINANGATNINFTYIPNEADRVTCLLTSSETCTTGNPATSNTITMMVNPVLPVSITIAASENNVCAGTPVYFTATPINGGSNPGYQWLIDSTPVTGATDATFTNIETSSNAISCLLTSSATCPTINPAVSNVSNITVNPLLPVSVIITASANPVCAGTGVTYTAIPVNGGSTPVIEWFKNGNPIAGASGVSCTFTPANGDIITCLLTSSETCTTGNPATSNPMVMIVNPLLPVSVTVAASSNPVCDGTTVTFTATPVNGGTSPDYLWMVNGLPVSGAMNATYSYIPVDNDIVVCVLTSGETCTTGNPATSAPIVMHVNPLLPVSVSISTPANPVCSGTDITFTAIPVNGGSFPSYQWNVNGADVEGATNSTWNSMQLGNNSVYCKLTSSEICTLINPVSSEPINMIVNPLLTVGVSISASANPVCAGTLVTLTATPVNGGTSPAYQWKKNYIDIPEATNATYTYTPANNDAITCMLTSSEPCTTGNTITSPPVIIIVNQLLPVGITIATSSNPVCAGTMVTLTASPVNGGINPSYQWKRNGIVVPGATNVTFSFIPVNGDVVTCELTSSENCTTGNPATSAPVTMVVNPLLPVSIIISSNPVSPVCAGTTVDYTATPVNGGSTPLYQWYVDGIPVTGATISTYSRVMGSGVSVSCTLTSTAVCPVNNPASSNILNMVVNPILPVSVSITASANPVCAGTQVTYTATPVNGGTNPVYQWKKNGSDVTGATNVTYSYIPANADSIRCTLNSNAICPSSSSVLSNKVVMTVNPLLPVSVSIVASANPVCAGTTVTYTATPVNGGTNPGYQWKVNGAIVNGATNVTYNLVPGNGNVITCVLTSNETCTSGNPATSNAISMTVNPLLPVSITIAASATTICAGTSVTLTASLVNGGTSPTCQWKRNGSIIIGATNLSYTFIPINGDILTCQLTSSEICTTGNPALSNALTFTVNPILTVDIAIAASANPVCTGTSVTFTATPVNGGTNPVYQWKVNGIPVPGATNSTYTFVPVNGDVVTCILTSSESCTSENQEESDPITMVVNPILPASVSIVVSVNPVCSGTAVTFTATPVNGGTNPQYQWKKNGTDISGATLVTYSYTPVNNDIITCKMTSNAICVSGSPDTSNAITMTVITSVPVSVSITASVYAVMPSTQVTYTAVPVNGGSSPTYQWKVNGSVVGTNSDTYTYAPANNDKITCVLTSNLSGCTSNNPATSNQIVEIVYVTGSPCTGVPTVSYGGLTYNTVQVGTQCWLRENINIGNMIQPTQEQTNNSTIEKYCYNNLEMNCNVYGGMYQWAEMVQYLNNATNTTNWSPVPSGNVQGICPSGWHIPTNTEWGSLMTYLGGISVTGGKIKQVGTNFFNIPNLGATNTSGFTSIPGGQRWSDGTFHYLNMSTGYWTVTSGVAGTDIYYGGSSYSINAATNGQFYKVTGISVRCLKD